MLVPDSMPVFNVKTINLVIASADGGLDSQLNLPQDMIDTLKKSVVAELRAIILGVPQDIKNDGVEILEPKA